MPHVKKYHTRSSNKKLSEPSTSKEPPDRSEAKTPEHADRNAKTPEPDNPNPPRPESPDNCSICLSTVENKSFTDSCLHTFCYVCLLEWSKVKAVCPLCKQNFKKIIYNVRSLDDFDEYVLPPPQPQRDHLWENFNAASFARFRYRTTLTQDRMDYVHRRRHPAGLGGLRGPTSRVVSREEVRQRRRQQAIQNRRRIYDFDMWVRPVSPTSLFDYSEHDYNSRYRETSPAFFTENDVARYALIPWLSRELNILLHGTEDNVHFVLELILDLIQRFEIRSDEFYELVHPLVGRHTRHFIHEFYHFARSPYDLATYDQRATYENRQGVPEANNANNESEDDDVMVVDSEGPGQAEASRATQTLSQILSRESGVPLSNIGPIDVTWNITDTLGDVRAFLQNAMAEETGFGLFSSGAAQMARIESQHNYASGRAGSGASSTTPTDSTPTTQTVNVDDDSDDDVIFVKYEKPYAERSPIVLSSGSDTETETAESEETKRRHKNKRHQDKVRRPHRSRSRSGHRSSGARNEVRRRVSGERSHRRSRSQERRSRSRDRRSRSGDRRSKARDETRRSRDEEQESRHRRSRSRDRRSRSRDQSSVLQRRSRSRSSARRSRSRDRTYSRDPRSHSGDRNSRSHHSSRHRRSRSRSRDRDVRHRSRHERRRHSSSESVEITRVKRRKAKKHKKHKKTHKRRRVASPKRPEVEEPSTSGDRKYKKHPTGHKSSKPLASVVVRPEPEARTLSSVVVKPTVTEPVLSSGFESGDHSGDSPIDVTTITDDVTQPTDDVTKRVPAVADDVTVSTLVTYPTTPDSIVRSLLDNLIDTVTSKPSGPSGSKLKPSTSGITNGASTSAIHSDNKMTAPALLGLLNLAWNKNGYVQQKPATPALPTRSTSPPSNAVQNTIDAQNSATPASTSSPTNQKAGSANPSRRTSPARSPRTYPLRPASPDSDSDCIMNADDDVVFEGECRCRASQKCAKCLHSSDSSSDEDSHDDSNDPMSPLSSPNPAKSRTYLPKTALPDVSCFVTIGNLIGNLGHSSRTQDPGCHSNTLPKPSNSGLVDLDAGETSETIDVENSSDHEIDIETVDDLDKSTEVIEDNIVIEDSGNHGNSRPSRSLSMELSVIKQAVSSRGATPVDVVSLEDCLVPATESVSITEPVLEIVTDNVTELITDTDVEQDNSVVECVEVRRGSARSSVDSTIDVETFTRDPERGVGHGAGVSVLSDSSSSPKVYTNLETCKPSSSSSISEEIDVISTSPVDVTSTPVDVISSSIIDVSGSIIDVTSTSPIDVTSSSPIDVMSTSNIDVTSTSPIDVTDVSLNPMLTSTSEEMTCPKSPQFDIDVDSVTDADSSLVIAPLAIESESENETLMIL